MLVKKILCIPRFVFKNSRCSLSCATFTPELPVNRTVNGSSRRLNLKERPLLYNKIIRDILITNQKSFASTGNGEIPIATYEEVKDLPKHPEKLLIDVREPEELKETGQIPTSINIPLKQLQSVLGDNKEEKPFDAKYGREFPKLSDEIIFTCRSGRRSQEAAEIAVKLGFTNVKNYKGSWLEWAEREGLPK